MSFRVRLTDDAADDLERLFDFVLQRERAVNDDDLDSTERELAVFVGCLGIISAISSVQIGAGRLAACRRSLDIWQRSWRCVRWGNPFLPDSCTLQETPPN
ncbi:hypothetical protein BLL52_2666 [Rhodoferax antarcticus ANT.BR]|uniref:Uncharacterized protein n=1 Tax=Rhodoferax antarcticus ANT.BR TaxID=1111071 RepID=A0A1Q8YEY7_9BURK|nr:hypothetical protein RA876_07415 [Rhodoferax antarcticus]OLP06430.1 hypothetical protein BLL52_2666 [Rhodoferax antarcticus ANT.BR]